MTATAIQTEHTIDSILDHLEQYHQRATYGAVAALVNSSPRSLMSGRERDHRSSWIVSRRDGRPTGYAEEQMDPSLGERERILSTPEELRAWLRDPS